MIGGALDLHCHLTERMTAAADIVITFKEYPHDDATPRAAEMLEVARRMLAGETAPVMALFDCPMIGLFLTKTAAMREIVDMMTAAEAEPGALSVSLGHGVPWADLPDMGARMLVVADGDRALAAATAERLGGKAEIASGQPVDLTVKVMRIARGLGQHLGEGREPLGTMMWLRAGNGLDLVASDLRTQVYHPEAFEQIGIRLAEKSLVVVKSLFRFFTPFDAIAERVIFAATPGRVNPNISRISYTRRAPDFWPLVEDPFGGAG